MQMLYKLYSLCSKRFWVQQQQQQNQQQQQQLTKDNLNTMEVWQAASMLEKGT